MTLATTTFGIRYEHLVFNNNIYIKKKLKIRKYDKALIKKNTSIFDNVNEDISVLSNKKWRFKYY